MGRCGAVNSSILIGYSNYSDPKFYADATPSFKMGHDYQQFLPWDDLRASKTPWTNNIGKDWFEGTAKPGFFSLQNGGGFMDVVNFVLPGMNNHANYHDALSTMISKNWSASAMGYLNVPTQNNGLIPIMAYS